MGRRLPLPVLLVAGLFLTQLLWWGYTLWTRGETQHETAFRSLQQLQALAEREIEDRERLGETREQAWREIAARFPGVVGVPGREGLGLQLSATELERLAGERAKRQRMVVFEGSFFLVMWSGALVFLLRTARRRSELALQESNFLHAVTHEFRSPLQSLRLAVESMVRRPDPTRARAYADGMLEDLTRLDGLVENVLAVGRLDAKAFDARPRRIDLAAAVRQEVDRYRARASGEDGWLEVGLPERGYAELSVTDQGRGFTADERRRLFERFWRAGDERVRTAPGSGLGLYLVRELARAQGATIQAHSDGPGRGARFTVRWPLAGAEQ
jgi:signal transduction histidine kinase